MGNGSSTGTRLVGSKLTSQDVGRLQKRFNRLAGPGGKVSIAQFQSMVELGANPFTGRMLQLFDGDNDNMLTLDEFTRAMDYFTNLDNVEEQYKFAFKIYDTDGDGYISADELHQTLSSLIGRSYPEAHLHQVVLNTMAEFDADGDNRLNFREFKALLSTTDLSNKFSLNF